MPKQKAVSRVRFSRLRTAVAVLSTTGMLATLGLSVVPTKPSLLSSVIGSAVALADSQSWTIAGSPGVSDLYSLQDVNGTLYGAGYPGVFVFDANKQTWSLVGTNSPRWISTLRYFNGTLFASQYENAAGTAVYEYHVNTNTWSVVGNVSNNTSLSVSNGNLYATSPNMYTDDHSVYKYDSSADTFVPLPSAPSWIISVQELNGTVYAGGGGGVYKLTSGAWTQLGSQPFAYVVSMTVFNGALYASTDNGVYAYDSASDSWSPIGNLPFISEYITALDGVLYATTGNSVWLYNTSSSSWTKLGGDLQNSSYAEWVVLSNGVFYEGGLGPVQELVDTAPITTAITSPPAPDGLNNWYIHPVIVSLNATDDISGVKQTFYSLDNGTTWNVYNQNSPVLLSQEGQNSVQYYSVDNVGNAETSHTLTVNVDQTAPSISGTATTPPNANGWYKGDVTVHFNASDSTSGLTSVTEDQTVSTEGVNQSVTGTAVDNAGNQASTTVTGINIDKKPPTISGAVTTTPNANGWYKAPVTVHFTSSDTLSGIDSTTPDQSVSSEGKDQSVPGTATDKAGNSASTTVSGLNIDLTPPTISGAATTKPNANGWYNTPVTVHFTATDALSGLASVTGDQVLMNDGASQSVQGTATDNADNTSFTTVSGINIDQTAPTATVTVDKPTLWPANNKLVPVNVTVKASDSVSGVASVTLKSITCNEPLSSGDIQGAKYGTDCTQFSLMATRNGNGTGRVYTITYTITNKAGNSTTAEVTVTVPHDQGKK